MSKLSILFGTETGNAEMVAEDLATALAEHGIETEVAGMEDCAVEELAGQDVLLVASTYGEGELPESAAPFFEALEQREPDLSSVRFAAFGLGDSTYDTYNNGIATLIAKFTALGATQIGATGYHDADSGLNPSDVAIDWAGTVFAPVAQA